MDPVMVDIPLMVDITSSFADEPKYNLGVPPVVSPSLSLTEPATHYLIKGMIMYATFSGCLFAEISVDVLLL